MFFLSNRFTRLSAYLPTYRCTANFNLFSFFLLALNPGIFSPFYLSLPSLPLSSVIASFLFNFGIRSPYQ
ncbi:hypothetical protein F4775DRAFT_535554 [Biscogniauxia sp. FL1348]|nr:hypothetical protein F4775DRAFT_535554 [Biscogniauxia sp. FL1348]